MIKLSCSTALLFVICLYFASCSSYDDSAVITRIEALENSTITSINQQVSAINSSISTLEALNVELKLTVLEMQSNGDSCISDILKLKEYDASIEAKITELKAYVEDELVSSKDWTQKTFSTIEQYNAIANDLLDLNTLVSSNYVNLSKKIDDSVDSIKSWVNVLMKNYYTSTQVDEKLIVLKTKIDALQNKLDKLLRDFSITFDDTSLGILAGGTTTISYTIVGATEKTIVKAFGQNGWNAKVNQSSANTGEVVVTAPNPLTDDEVVVLVYDGEYRTIMSSINFVTGVITPSTTTNNLPAEAGAIDIMVTTNLAYRVVIPESAKEWLTVAETRSTRTDRITFSYMANETGIRIAKVDLTDFAGNVLSTISFIQQGNATEVTLTEAGTLMEVLGTDKYQYTMNLIINGPINGTDFIAIKRMLTLKYLNLSNATLKAGGAKYFESSNDANDCYIYDNTIGDCAFSTLTNLKTVLLPDSTVKIGAAAFLACISLENINIPKSVKRIGFWAFSGCKNLKQITIPDNVNINIKDVEVFNNCSSLGYARIPDSWSIIPRGFFGHCNKLEDVNIPSGVVDFEEGCYLNCYPLKNITLANGVSKIGTLSFHASSVTELIIPETVEYIGDRAFGNCTKLKEIHIKGTSNTLSTIHQTAFSGCNSTTTMVYVPKGTKKDFLLTGLGYFTNIVEE